jgi:GTP-binding protein
MALKIQSVVFKISAQKAEQADVDALPQIAFAGRSNVGKSSLLNALAHQRQLARVSNTPGRTQSINLFLVNDKFYFADLPGYGFAKVPKKMKEQWGRQVQAYLADAPNLAGVVCIFDVRRTLREDDLDLLAWLAQQERPVLPVLTKVDKLKRNELNKQLKRWRTDLEDRAGCKPVQFSATNRTGKPELLTKMEAMLNGELEAASPDAFEEYDL